MAGTAVAAWQRTGVLRLRTGKILARRSGPGWIRIRI
jgi:hypothetical protein